MASVFSEVDRVNRITKKIQDLVKNQFDTAIVLEQQGTLVQVDSNLHLNDITKYSKVMAAHVNAAVPPYYQEHLDIELRDKPLINDI